MFNTSFKLKLRCSVIIKLKIHKSDLLICHATAQGDSAIRHPVNGSYFIKEFCQNLRRENDFFQVYFLIIVIEKLKFIKP